MDQKSLIEFLNTHPHYIDILKQILNIEEKNPLSDSAWLDHSETGTGWQLGEDLFLIPGHVSTLTGHGILRKFGSNSTKLYHLRDSALVREVIDNLDTLTSPTVFEPIDIPDDLFDIIVGYEDIKELVTLSLNAVDPVNILFHGSPATGKTLFLMEIARLPKAKYTPGSSSSGAGLTDFLFNHMPDYLLIDEIDKMNKDDYAILLNLLEMGLVSEMKKNRTREIYLNTRTYACANRLRTLTPELQSRFMILHLDDYDDATFHEVVKRTLIIREKADPEISSYIADKITAMEHKDVRVAIRVSRLAKNKKTVDLVLKTMNKYTRK